MPSFEFRLDLSRCIGCGACEVACVTANDLQPTGSRNKVTLLESEDQVHGDTTFVPSLCHHCEDPPCVEACPTGASFKAEDGRVLVDHDICIGCGLCVPACPYGARYVEPVTNLLQKCTLCEGRVEQGLAPACFDVCPAGARTFLEIREVDGEEVRIAVGDVHAVDQGHEVMSLTTNDIDPGPRLEFSGRPEHLALLTQQLGPRANPSAQSLLWRNGAGKAVGGLGVASAVAMGAMIGVNALRERKEKVAADEKKEDSK